jgi:hypothetical protein
MTPIIYETSANTVSNVHLFVMLATLQSRLFEQAEVPRETYVKTTKQSWEHHLFHLLDFNGYFNWWDIQGVPP